MPLLVCTKCGVTMRPKKTGVTAIEYRDPQLIDPYRLYSCDRYICHLCGASVLTGWGKPVEHYDSRFEEKVKEAEDCGEIIKFF